MKSDLAIFGGNPIRKNTISYNGPIMGNEEIKAVTEVLKTKKLSTFYANFMGGTKVQEFERNFAKFNKTKYAVSVNSGTAALHVALAALNVGPGDEVVVPAYTFTATATSVLMNNAIPVFADVDPLTFNIDPKSIEQKITKRTKAIIPVHLLGNPANMDEILEIGESHELKIIEDACQAIGAKYKGKIVGTFGDLGVHSLQETKNIMTGEGGMIVTDNEEVVQRCRLIRNHGEASTVLKSKPRSYISNILGWNYRMTEMEAAIGIEQLKRLHMLNNIRIENSKFLINELSKFDGIKPQKISPEAKSVHHLCGFVFDKNKIGIHREKFIQAMKAEGVPLSSGYPHPLYDNPLFRHKTVYGLTGCPFSCKFYKSNIEYKSGDCPNTEQLCNETALWIPHIRPPFGITDMQDIVSAFEKVIKNARFLS